MTLRTLPVTIAVACLALSACGGDDDTAEPTATTGAPVATTAPTPATTVPAPVATTAPPAATTPATTAPAPTTAATVAPTTAPAPPTTAADPLAVLNGLLLTDADVNALGDGDELFDVGWSDDPSEEGPCGTPGLDTTVPPIAEVGATLSTVRQDIALIQLIKIYDSSDTGIEAAQVALDVISCGTTPDGQYTFGEPVDITAEIVTDPEVSPEEDFSVKAIDFTTADGYGGVAVLAHYNDSLITFQFIRGADVPDERLPADTMAVVEAGLSKVFSVLV